jgi:hypothetical protein
MLLIRGVPAKDYVSAGGSCRGQVFSGGQERAHAVPDNQMDGREFYLT